METLAERQGTFRLYRIDIRDWDSPVAKSHGITKLPTLLLYNGTKLVSKDQKEILKTLNQEI